MWVNLSNQKATTCKPLDERKQDRTTTTTTTIITTAI
jgi:hypothetical protein